MTLGKNIRRIRRLKNLSQSQLAERTGYSLQTISRIERDQWNGSFRVIRDIAKFFGVKAEELDETIKEDDISLLPPPIVPDFSTFNKATIIETIKPVVESSREREKIASRLTDMLDARRLRQAPPIKNTSEVKCQIMERVMAIESVETLEVINDFIEFKQATEKKMENPDAEKSLKLGRNEELKR